MKYHKNIFFPAGHNKKLFDIHNIIIENQLIWTHHAKQRLVNKFNIQNFSIWYKNISLNIDNIIEYTMQEDEKIEKVLYRLSYNAENDILISISNKGYILTIWKNKKADKHNTLNIKEYAIN